MNEWRVIPGFDRYEVSTVGQVRRVGSHCLKPTVTAKGYFRVSLWNGVGYRCCYIHALVLIAFSGPRPDGFQSRHLNGIKTDNRACNLAWGTHAENVADKFLHGNLARGSKNGKTVLTEEQVRRIRREAATVAHKAIARNLGLNRSTVQDVLKGRTWGHLDQAAAGAGK